MSACVTIGNFDGVHLGHQSLISLARQTAVSEDLDFYLITFWPHPRAVLKNGIAHRPLLGRMEKKHFLRLAGADRIIELPFTPELAVQSAMEFVTTALAPLDTAKLVIGHDFSLGREREGNAARLVEIGRSSGFDVVQAPAFSVAGIPVSSTRLRNAIQEGEVAQAASLLGRRHFVNGKVIHGYGRGGKIGFPTANLIEPDALLPANGVYATLAELDGKRFRSVTNIGFNPTFDNASLSIETFFLDANLDLYGRELRLEFVELLRHERKFASASDLAGQIALDVDQARSVLPHS